MLGTKDLEKRIAYLESMIFPSDDEVKNKFTREQLASSARRASVQRDAVVYTNKKQGKSIVAEEIANGGIHITIWDRWSEESHFIEIVIPASDKCEIGRKIREAFRF